MSVLVYLLIWIGVMIHSCEVVWLMNLESMLLLSYYKIGGMMITQWKVFLDWNFDSWKRLSFF